jgi:hypothetical protein
MHSNNWVDYGITLFTITVTGISTLDELCALSEIWHTSVKFSQSVYWG